MKSCKDRHLAVLVDKEKKVMSHAGAENKCNCKALDPVLAEVSWWSSVESNGS